MVFNVIEATFLMTLLLKKFTRPVTPTYISCNEILKKVGYILHPHIFVMKCCHG